MAIISVRDLHKNYVTDEGVVTPVLHGVNLEIERGEFVALMGPSGSGKSTFMNIIGCLDSQTSGGYWLDGRDVATLSSDQCAELRNRVIGFVFQGFNLLPRRNALENVALPLVCAGMERPAWRKRAAEILDRVGLAGKHLSLPNQLSGGQQQRVAIARALANKPSLILADEPTGNLDTATSVEIMRLLSDLHGQDGTTIVLVTHEPDVASYASRLITFRDGVVVHDGAVNREGMSA